MPNIKPVSELRNYKKVLDDVTVGKPVFLTKNGRGRYAILDINEYEKMQATLQLMQALVKGKKSGEKKVGYHTRKQKLCSRQKTMNNLRYSPEAVNDLNEIGNISVKTQKAHQLPKTQ